MKKILITGGAGFIGSNFIRYFLEQHPEYSVINYDILTYAGNPDNLKDLEKNPRYEFVQGDICDFEKVRELTKKVDAVINFAAETHVDRSILDASAFINTNVKGVQILLEAARDNSVSRFLHISTDEVYGSIENGSFSENSPFAPNSPYAASKAAADLLARSYFITYQMPILIVRSSNNFGPYQYPEKVIPLFITNALENESLPLYGDGLNVRDWLYVLDNARAIDIVFHEGKIGEAYNIGANNEITNRDLTNRILEIMDRPKSLIKFVKDRPGHDKRYSLVTDKMRKLGWRPLYKFEDALDETVNWYLKNKEWWQKIKNKRQEYKNYYQKQYDKR
ncbi:MAG: dTDP-glucose 4,6-dehydratase [Candidatus Omnitrophota bacterium]